MKRSLFQIFVIVSAIIFVPKTGISQITITKSSTPQAAEDIIFTESNRSVDVSKTGPNFTWDFSKINPTRQDTYKFIAPKDISITYGISFIGDLALDLKNPSLKDMFAFFKPSNTDFRQVGLGITIPIAKVQIPLQYSSPDIVYRFPVNYGNIDSCNYGGDATFGTLKASISGKRVNIVDGWGKIITPYKTYDCLRIKSIVLELDTLAGMPQDNSRIEYKWVAVDEHIPVFQANVIFTGGVASSMHLIFRDTYKNNIDPTGAQVDFDASDTTVFSKDTVSFHDKTKNLKSWLWDITPSTASFVGGTNKNSQNPKIVFNAIGSYTVSLKGTDSSGIGNIMLKKDYISVTHNTAINIQNFNARLSVYPNPSNGNISIHLNDMKNGSRFKIIVTNSVGQQVYNELLVGNEQDFIIKLNKSKVGLYFVKVVSESQTLVSEFFVN